LPRPSKNGGVHPAYTDGECLLVLGKWQGVAGPLARNPR